MKGGYPRFVLHPFVKKLMNFCFEKFGNGLESCLLLSSRAACHDCRAFIRNRADTSQIAIRLVEYVITPDYIKIADASIPLIDSKAPILYLILFPVTLKSIAKEYWQHTGAGISSRFAEYCLVLLNIHFPLLQLTPPSSEQEHDDLRIGKGARKSSAKKANIQDSKRLEERVWQALAMDEADLYVEERFGRNLDQGLVGEAKTRLKERIAGVLGDHNEVEGNYPGLKSSRSVTPESVFLFPCGMASIYFSYQVVQNMYPGFKTVQFGFPYIDTLKIQEKWGSGCTFFGLGDLGDLRKLEALLEHEKIGAVYCEFPSNPLLISPPIEKLWELSQKHNFLLVVDETIGNFCNVKLLDNCHLLVSSLTKVFSGDSNVMGGSLVLNLAAPQASGILDKIQEMYKDVVWGQDAIFLERNSRKFKERIQIINSNAEQLCDAIKSHPKVEQLYYPKYTSKEAYVSFVTNPQSPGFGGLFSIVLKTKAQAERFYDALDVYKGPSLGTSFTLVCPYTVLAHYTELNWASSFGVSPWLVRVSVGLENSDELIKVFIKALEAA